MPTASRRIIEVEATTSFHLKGASIAVLFEAPFGGYLQVVFTARTADYYSKNSSKRVHVNEGRKSCLLKPEDKMFGFFKSREILLKAIRASNHAGKALQFRGWGRYLIGRMIVDLLLWPSDFLAVRRQYASLFSRPPKLLCPKTFNEKLQREKLFRRRSRQTIFADKIAVRDYVKQKVGSHVLPKLYWTGTDLRTAPHGILPKKFVIKTNQGSGFNLIVRDAASLDWEAAHKQTQQWLRQDYSVHFAEWQYRWIKPRVLIEEFLEGPDGGVPLDYKFFCFRGRAEMVQIDFDRFTNHMRAFYDRNFQLLPFGLQYPRQARIAPKPDCFEKMLQLAESLAGPEPFLRVDLYDIGRPIFGELTLTPEAGLGRFDPPEYDVILGELMR